MKTHLTYFASFILAAFLTLVVSTETHATVWTVSNNPNSPGQYTSLQMAVDSSTMGDTILVADGTYSGDGNRDIEFGGKSITVRSENGPNNCIIDSNDKI